MPEAVVVATARSPIGRAFKGSLVDFRADDLATTIIRTALDQVPQLDPHTINDLIMGCGLPGGEQGFNLGRVVAVKLGLDDVPGTTITRYCSSSLQSTRMAFHAIKAGEGDVFISAGVEMVSRFLKGNSDSLPDTQDPIVRRRRGAFGDHGRRATSTGATRASPATSRTSTSRWARPRRTSRRSRASQPRRAGRVRGAVAEPRREGDRERLLGARDHPGRRAERHRHRARTTARAPASPSRASPASSRCSAPTAR